MSTDRTSLSEETTTRRRADARVRRAGCDGACRFTGTTGALRRQLQTDEPCALGVWELCLGCRRACFDDALRTLRDAVVAADGALALLRSSERDPIQRTVRSALRDRGREAVDCEFSLGPDATGEPRQIRARTRVLRDADGRPVYLVGSLCDVTPQRRQSRELARRHDVLRIALRSLGAGIVTTDLDGRVQWLNPVAERMLDIAADEAQGQLLDRIAPPVDGQSQEPLTDVVRRCLHEGRVSELGGERLLLARSGEERAFECEVTTIRDEHGEVYGCVVALHDVTEGRARSRELSYLAAHDQLTGLINRREFENRLSVLNENRQDTDDAHAVLFIDLDRFKQVNDRCGHAAGDALLRGIAQLLRHAVREVDTVARIGGDEFAVILSHCPVPQGLEVARQLCVAVDTFRFRHAAETFAVGASIGMAVIDGSWPNIETLLRAADAACYRAKQAGRGCVRLCRREEATLTVEVPSGPHPDTLRLALEEGRFRPFAQRIQTLERAGDGALPSSGTLCEAEILLRLVEPDGDVLPPGAFLPAAERGNLMPTIDRWVTAQVLHWLSHSPGADRVDRLWINLSGQSLTDAGFTSWLIEALDALDAARRARLCFELDELVAVNNLAETARLVGALRDRNVGVALDRFGAGTTSYGYLKGLPVDYLKIDGQFVRGLGRESLNAASVRCFVEVANLLDIRTIAGFVETEDELMRLAELGVDRIQGRLLHEAAPLEEVFPEFDSSLPAIA